MQMLAHGYSKEWPGCHLPVLEHVGKAWQTRGLSTRSYNFKDITELSVLSFMSSNNTAGLLTVIRMTYLCGSVWYSIRVETGFNTGEYSSLSK